TTFRMNALGCQSARGSVTAAAAKATASAVHGHRPLLPKISRSTARPVKPRYCFVTTKTPAAKPAPTGVRIIRNTVRASRKMPIGSVHPCSITVIEQGWTEPIGIFLLALTVFLMIRTPVGAGFAAGVFVVTKQYLGFTGLAVLRLIFGNSGRWPWTALAVAFAAAAVTLP